MKPIDTLVLNDENGEKINVPVKEYEKKIIADLGLKPQTGNDPDGESREVTPQVAVTHIVKSLTKGQPVDPLIAELFGDAVTQITADFAIHTENTTEAKETAEEKKAKKEAEKKEKEEKEQAAKLELAKTQEAVAVKIDSGMKQAYSEFKTELENIRGHLADGVTVVESGGGYGLAFSDDVTKESVAASMGYMIGKARNNDALKNQMGFWIGDYVNWLVTKGIYPTAKDAGKAVFTLIGSTDSKYSDSAISYYAKMADRTPVSLRNPHADQSAYLKIANMKLPQKGKDEVGKDEDQAAFEKRKAAFEKGRKELQEKLMNGEIKAHKEVLEPIEKLLIETGLKKKEDPDAVLNITQLLKTVYFCNTGLEHFLDVHEEGVAIYTDGKKNYPLSKEELEEQRDEALAKLHGFFYGSDKKTGLTIKEFAKGFIMSKKKAVKKAGADGAKIEEEEVKVNVYPEVFWDVTKNEAPAEPAAAEPAAAEPAKEEKPAKAGK